MTKFVDLSHVIEAGMITYKGLPAPLICDHLSRLKSREFYEPGTEFQIGKIEMVGNTGTYIDTPFHRYETGYDLAGLLLAQISHVPGIVVPADYAAGAIGPEIFENYDVNAKAILVRTLWDRHWRTDQYFEGHPFLTAEAAGLLLARGAVLVGIDSYNIDDVSGKARPVHSLLLGAGIPIVEHMTNLAGLADREFWFSAVPPKIAGMGTFAVRAHAILAP